MMGSKFAFTKSLAIASMLSMAIAMGSGPALSAEAADGGKTTLVSATVPGTSETQSEQGAPAKKTLKARVQEAMPKVKAALQKVNPIRLLRDKEFKKASAEFPDFCKDWERKLRDRETNNVNHITWTAKDGYQTATYVGYSPVRKCECHQSTDGYSIGKVTYDEFQYYLVGKTPDEAKHAKPKVTDDTATTELFRWDKEKWFY